MKYIKSLIVFILILAIFSIVFNTTHANAKVLLLEDFNTQTIDTTNTWQVLNETGVNIFNDSNLLVSPVDTKRSVFLENKIPFSTDLGIEYEIRFRFNTLSFGSGIAVNDTPVTLRSLIHPDTDDWSIFLWPTGTNSFKVFSVPCPIFGTCLPTDNPLFTVTGAESLDWHVLRIKYISGRYLIKLDDLQEIETTTTARGPKYVWLGNPMITNGTGFSTFEVDYLKVFDMSPAFPYLSQKDPLWGSKEYDSAKTWAGVDKSGIDRWGCALTSVAMILQNYNIKTASGDTVNPDNLNEWLKIQPDGYIGPGLLNWLALTRYENISFLI